MFGSGSQVWSQVRGAGGDSVTVEQDGSSVVLDFKVFLPFALQIGTD